MVMSSELAIPVSFTSLVLTFGRDWILWDGTSYRL
jgi:hypothetical protein